MKQKYFLFLVIFLAGTFFYYCKAQKIITKQNEVVIYSNSFESPQDTVGWRGNGMIDFSSDVPPGTGLKSLYISGGCIWPHASIELGPFNKDGLFQLRCWGKDLDIGGSVGLEIKNDSPTKSINIIIDKKEWSPYESERLLYCPEGKKIILSMGAGGIVPSAMLIDMLQIINVKAANPPWLVRNSGTTEKLNDVVILDSSTAVVVGNRGSILKTTDSGESWKNTAPQIDCNPGEDCIISWNCVSFYNKLNGIVGGESAILITSDGGEEWQFLNSPSENNFISIGKTGLFDIYIGDDSGNIYNSLDSGKTWTSEHITDSPIRSIFPYAGPTFEGALYALTTHSLFIKNFYATSWEEGPPLGHFYGLGSGAYNGGFSDDGTGFIVGVEGDFVSKSTIIRLRLPDSHWFSVGPENVFGELYGLSIPTSNVIYTCGSNGKILKSTNEGDYWVSLNTPTLHPLNSIYFFDNERGFAVGDSGTILYTSNGGISSSNNPPSAFHLLKPVNEDSMQVMRSIGFEWQEAIDPDDDAVHYTLLISGDTGKTWKAYGPVTDTTRLQVHSPAQTPGKYFWMVIANDGMLATPSKDVFVFNIYSVSNVDNQEDNNTEAFTLLQNYPNPFNITTKIKFVIPESSFINLKIYDALGREVATLVNEEKPAGEYNVRIDGSNLSSGIYFYILNTRDKTISKKMCLLR